MRREDEKNEFKKTTGEINEAMVSISSILNKHHEGTIYFGLKNDGTPVKFQIIDSTIRDVSRKIYEAIKPQIYPKIEIEVIDGIDVIKVEFNGDDVPYSAFGKYYIRTADEDRELTPSELRKIMIGREYEDNWEEKLSSETIDDVDESCLKKFYDQAIGCGRMPRFEFDKEQLLEKLGVLRNGYLTNAGRVLFSANEPLEIKMAIFATDHKENFIDIADSRGNIINLIDEAIAYVTKNIRWAVKLSDDGIHRKEIPEIPIEAIREAIINSFAHARYDVKVKHEIDIFADRISIINPGNFANEFLPVDFYKQDIHSYLRNEKIARVLYLGNDVEAFGTGLRKIYGLCEERAVNVSFQNNENDFMLEFSRIDINLPNGIINGTINGTINDSEKLVLDILMKEPTITVAEISERIDKSVRTINRIMNSLKEKKLVERVGSNKDGYWRTK